MGFKKLEKRARDIGVRKIAVVCAHDSNVLKAVERATEKNIATAYLIGDEKRILEEAKEAHVDLDPHKIRHAADDEEAARIAMALAAESSVSAIMKGKTTTAKLMHVLIEDGLRKEGRLLSHIAGFEHPRMGKDKLMVLTDAGLVTFPTLDQRIQIIKNAVGVVRSFGIIEPKTAVLSLTEEVTDQIPISVEASKLKEMNKPGGELDGFGIVDGPMDLFCALDSEIAKAKGVDSEIAGFTDILHCPNAVAGNLMSKAIIYFAEEARTGGAVIGGIVPVSLLSRASSADDKYCSLLLGLSCASA